MSMITWWMIAAGLLGAVIAIVAVIVSQRRSRGGDGTDTVRATLVVAVLWAVLSAIGAVVAVTVALLQPQIDITVPVREFWPELPAGTEVDGMTATIAGGGFTSAELHADGLSMGVRVCSALSRFCGWLVPATLAALIAIACSRLLAGRPFAPVVARMATITAVVVLVGGLAAQVLGDVAGSMAASELLAWESAMVPTATPGIEDALTAWWPQPGLRIDLPIWPVAGGLAFAALAAVFRHGSRLQRDTEGLV